jgi:hypothetical protein
MDAQTSLPYGNARPDVIDELLLRDDLTRAVGKIDQNIQRPTAEGKHLTVAPQRPFANRKFERAESQLPMNGGARHVSAKTTHFLRMPTVGRQAPQLYARNVGRNETRSLPDTFGKDD